MVAFAGEPAGTPERRLHQQHRLLQRHGQALDLVQDSLGLLQAEMLAAGVVQPQQGVGLLPLAWSRPQGPQVPAAGVLQGVNRLGIGPGAQQEGVGGGGLPGGEVLARDRGGPRSERLQVHRHPPVPQPAGFGRGAPRHRLVDQLVGLVVVAQQALAVELGERVPHRRRRQLQHRTRQLQREEGAAERSHPQQIVRGSRQAPEPGLEDAGPAVGHAAVVALDRRRPAVPQELQRVEGVAARQLEDLAGWRPVTAAHIVDELAQLIGVERRQLDDLRQPRVGGALHLAQVLRRQLVRPRRAQRARMRVREARDEVRPELEAGGVPQVEIVVEQGHPRLERAVHHGGDGLEQAQLLGLAGDRLLAGGRLELAGKDARELGAHPRLRSELGLRVEDVAQAACDGGIGHVALARQPLRHDDVALAAEEVLQQSRLADAGLARHHDGAHPVPGKLKPLPGRRATDQPRRAPQGHRQGTRLAGGNALHGAGVDRPGQLHCVGQRVDREGIVQHRLAAVVGVQCLGAIAGQVVQSHRPPVGALRQRVERQQALRLLQGAADVAGGLEPLSLGLHGPRHRLGEARPLGLQPLGHIGAIVELLAAQQNRGLAAPALRDSVAVAGILEAPQLRHVGVGVSQPHLVGCRQQVVEAAQAVEQLPQVVPRTRLDDGGPQQSGQGGARRRPLQRHVRQQRRRLPLERLLRSLAQAHGWCAEEHDPPPIRHCRAIVRP